MPHICASNCNDCFFSNKNTVNKNEPMYVTNDVIALRLIQEVVIVTIRRCTPAGFKLTKLFGIDDFSVAKDFGKVFIIIIYCFYNYYYYLSKSKSRITVCSWEAQWRGDRACGLKPLRRA